MSSHTALFLRLVGAGLACNRAKLPNLAAYNTIKPTQEVLKDITTFKTLNRDESILLLQDLNQITLTVAQNIAEAPSVRPEKSNPVLNWPENYP